MALSKFTPVRLLLPVLGPAALIGLVQVEVIAMETAMALGTSLSLLVMFGFHPLLAKFPGFADHHDWLWYRCRPEDTLRLAGALLRLHPSTASCVPTRVSVDENGRTTAFRLADGRAFTAKADDHPAFAVMNHRANRPRIVAPGPVVLSVITLDVPPEDDLSYQELAARHAEDREIVARACERAGIDPAPYLD